MTALAAVPQAAHGGGPAAGNTATRALMRNAGAANQNSSPVAQVPHAVYCMQVYRSLCYCEIAPRGWSPLSRVLL